MQTNNQQKSLYDHVLTSLREDIIKRQYNDHSKTITEAEVASRYNVSKTPAREALGCLCSEGLLEKIPRKGYFVKHLTVTELKNLFQLRMILELAIIEICARKITPQDLEKLYAMCDEGDGFNEDIPLQTFIDHNDRFHVLLAEITRNPYLVTSLKQTLNRLCRTERHFRYSTKKERLANHRPQVDILSRKDPELALEHCRARLMETYKRLYPDADEL